MLSRASNLGGHGSLMGKVVQERMANRPIGYRQIDLSKFSSAIGSVSTPEFNNDVNLMADNISNSLYNIVSSSKMSKSEHSDVSRSVAGADAPLSSSIWDRLLQDPDDTRVWKAINWKGQLTFNGLYNETPSDIEFKSFYDTHITNQSQESQSDMMNDINAVNVPILDSQIDPSEVIEQINVMKSDKSCGLDGIPPGVYKLLTPEWIILITTLFNLIFTSSCYPISWSKAKLFMLFKRGNRKDPNNYRGISIINFIAKLFDMILCSRL